MCNQATRPKVYQHIISTVEHINNTKLESRDWINEEEATALRTAALKCFVTIMKSLVKWQNTRSPGGVRAVTSRDRENSSGSNLKPLAINPEEKKHDDDLVRSGSMSSINGVSPPPMNNEEVSVSISTSEMTFPFESSTNTPNYHDIFLTQKKKEETFRNGVVKFNIKPHV